MRLIYNSPALNRSAILQAMADNKQEALAEALKRVDNEYELTPERYELMLKKFRRGEMLKNILKDAGMGDITKMLKIKHVKEEGDNL